ncbi:MAG: hypothetical protein ABFD54_08530 [Armatimonadota bacterium]|nr:hypothetical protein [bacterium]
MRRSLIVLLAVCTLAAASACCIAADTAQGLVTPPSIYTPFGGRVVTEINFSDTDVLCIIRQAVPAISEAVAGSAAQKQVISTEDESQEPSALAVLDSLDLNTFMDALAGIKNIRLVGVKYGRKLTVTQALAEFNAGVAKTGRFSKVASDLGSFPGVFALYAEENNAGYIGFAYEPSTRMLYAGRIVGSVDVPKLAKWAVNAAKIIPDLKKLPIPVPENTGDDDAEVDNVPANLELHHQ